MVKKIILYGSKDCPWTEKITDLLSEKGLKFTYHDVVEDYHKRDELVRKSDHYLLPVTDFSGTIISGYDEEKLQKAMH